MTTATYPYLRFHIVLRPSGLGAAVPRSEITAPLLRRVLGKALIDAFCPFGRPRCQPPARRGNGQPRPQDHCHMAGACPYGVLYASSLTGRPPFALYVPPVNASSAAGPRILELTLLGPAWRLYSWALAALQRALQNGLGRDRQPWQIVRIDRVAPDRSGRRLCDNGLHRLPSLLEPDTFGLVSRRYLSPQPVEVRLLSPTRLICDGKLVRGNGDVPFQLLIARILDRFQGIFGDSTPLLRPETRQAIESQAARVSLLESQVQWIEVPDYSSRTRSELLFGGKVGRLVYGESAAGFRPILKAGEILQMGKNPAAGCGRIQVASPARIQAAKVATRQVIAG